MRTGPVRPKKEALVFSVDVGGTEIKAAVMNVRGKMVSEWVRQKTVYPLTPSRFEKVLRKLADELPCFHRAAIGFPGFVRNGKVLTAPHFGNKAWSGYAAQKRLGKVLGCPARVLNDADMQGLAVIRGKGLELVVTLGTGVGTALFRDGELMPHLELAHHPVTLGKTYNQYIGDKARKHLGPVLWNKRVRQVLDILQSLTHYDRVYIGGGNAVRITGKLERTMKRVSNRAGTLGGAVLWQREKGSFGLSHFLKPLGQEKI